MAFFTKNEARAAAAGARGYRTAKAVLTATMENYNRTRSSTFSCHTPLTIQTLFWG